ncbi:XrtA/PEP-CTERM system histidine kinase PrsK [Motilimonas cestriensis]|uniref:XrtA/PEP-CTERM system histidine kinase PrsK n=1 Tax=Motilimonas cestriensis TaxID=2742685 RepID=UPI003DA4FA81
MAFLSYLSAGLAYLFFAALLLAAKVKSNSGKLLLLVCFVGVLWSLQVLLYFELTWGELTDFLLLDGLRSVSWLIFIICLMEPEAPIGKQLMRSSWFWLSLVILAGLIYNLLLNPLMSPLWSYYLNIFLVVQVLVHLERVYRHLTMEHRWRLKPLVLYLGLIFGFDFFFYAQAALFAEFDTEFWQARGFVHFLTLPMLVIATRRTTHWSARIYVSRDVVFHSSLMMLAGLYLLLMALVGYYIKYMGGEWDRAIQLLFAVVALLMLAVVFFSESFRQKVKVFIAKHFFANRYEYRDEWLSLTQDLMEQTEQSSPYQHALTIMLKRLSADTGFIYQTQGKQVTKMAQSDSARALPSNAVAPLVEYFKQHNWLIDLVELRNSPQRYPDLVVPPALINQSQVWLVVPAFYQQELIGIMLIGPSRALRQLNWEDRDYIKVIAKQLAHYLVLHQAHSELAEAKQFQAFNQMSAFLVHDLKNTLAQLSLIVSNAEKHKTNPEFIDDSLLTIDNAVQRISRVVDHFRPNEHQPSCLAAVSLRELLKRVCHERSHVMPVPSLLVEHDVTLYTDATRLQEVLLHLVQNAQEATSEQGEVSLSLQVSDSMVDIHIQDTGCGMDDDFIRQRLFTPFDTTKGNAGMGIGVYEARQFAMVNQGQLTVSSEVGVGSHFTLSLPLPEQTNQ